MRKALSLFALAVASTALAQQQVSLVIARDGAEPLSEAERLALLTPTEERIAKLIKDGFERVSIDNWGVLLIDRTAPPFRDVRIERILLTELPLDGRPIPFGSLSKDAQRALVGGYASASLNHQFGPDTLIAFKAMANFKLNGGGRSYTQTKHLAGPSYEQVTEMSKSAAKRQTPEQQEKISARFGSSKAELAFDRRQTPEAQAELYKRCSEEISKLLEAELKARDEARLRALRHLAEKHQIPDNSWSKESISDADMKNFADSVSNSWAAIGFDSKEGAQNWFNGASLENAYVSFYIAFGDGAAISNGPVQGMYQFGTTRR